MSELQPITILHVDDDEANRYVTTRMLRGTGYMVIEAGTGAEGISLAIARRPDLIILDVRLPDMNGFEVCKRLKATPATASIPILHLSATFTRSQDKVQGLEGGADGYLAQPVEAIELIATIRALLRMRRAEESARILAQEWQTTFDAINDGVCLLNLEGRVLRCNHAMTEILKKPTSQIVGCLHQDLISELSDGIPFCRIQEIRRRESREIQMNHQWYSITVDPICDHEQFTGAVYIVADISDRKRTELENARLYHEAQDTNRMKDEFLATLSHELRSPLNAMLGWAKLLNSRKLDELTTLRAISTIERNATAQAQLVEDLLDVSRIIQGKFRLEMQAVDLVTVVQAAIGTVRPAADAKEIYLQTVLEPVSSFVAGDVNRLQQVVWNLLSNAIKFTPNQGCAYIGLREIDSQVEITVSDTGQGIDPEFLPYVFDRFRQADSSSTRSHGGLGLGLAIVRHLVELHGGSVYADSLGKGQGATFTVKLPLIPVQSDSSLEDSLPAIKRLPSPSVPSLVGVKAIVVDDESDAREFVVATLEQCGAEVVAVASAVEAIAVVSQFQADILISDIGMPGEDGYSLIRKVRALEQGKRIPAVALTAYARAEDRARAISEGFQMHLPKPIEPVELATIVSNLAKKTRVL